MVPIAIDNLIYRIKNEDFVVLLCLEDNPLYYDNPINNIELRKFLEKITLEYKAINMLEGYYNLK